MVAIALSVFLAASTAAPAAPPSTLRGVLLEQLKTTHNTKDWFVPANTAVDGLTADQAKWNDGKGNHSVGQLAAHLIFWNREQLAKFKGETPPKFSGDNNETFNSFDAAKWAQTQKDLDAVMNDAVALKDEYRKPTLQPELILLALLRHPDTAAARLSSLDRRPCACRCAPTSATTWKPW